MKKDNIVLIGFMGTGKTTVGKIISEKLCYTFIDTDVEIERQCNTSIKQIFEEKGELFFREIEAEVVSKVSTIDKAVIACGGGVVKSLDNINNLRKKGFLVCLKANPEIIYSRICSGNTRPLAAQKSKEEITRLINEREHLYSLAEVSIDTVNDNPVSVAEKIINLFKQYNAI